MVTFPNAKINLGLDIVAKRPDGYHDLRSLMVGIGWCDILEIVPNGTGRATLSVSGRQCGCPVDDNLVMKAWRALGPLPGVDMFLRKVVPDGAGLGGGSADAAFALKMLNELFALGRSEQELSAVAASIGADCPFFIADCPALATGTGTSLQPVEIPVLRDLRIAVVKPRGMSVATKTAYSRVTPAPSSSPAAHLLPLHEWNAKLKNDFELSVFAVFPELECIKQQLAQLPGCVYAAMSGSGSALFGIFPPENLPDATVLQAQFPQADVFAGEFINV